MIRKGGMFGTIKYQESTVGSGAQLTKVWKIRHKNVPVRVTMFPKKKEFLLYGGQSIMAEGMIRLETLSDIENRDIIEVEGTEYQIKYIKDWSEQERIQTIYVDRYISE